MQFRSWMPQMVIERFGDFTHDSDLETYQFGKTRQFMRDFFSPKIIGLSKEIIFGLGTNAIDTAKQRYVEFRNKAEENGEDFNITETEFIDMYLANMRSQIRELALICSTVALIFTAKPGHDDSDDKKGMRKMMERAFSKYQNELSFYYLPTSFTTLVKSPIPIVGVLTDLQSFISQSALQTFGFATGDEELQKESHPMKYFGKLIPIVKEGIQWFGALDEDFAKENGIKL